MSDHARSRSATADFVGTRWLGVGLATVLAVVTLSLALTGRLGLYINPESTWFAVSMSVLVLVGAVLSFTLPLGAEADHGHDHGDAGEVGASDIGPAASAHVHDAHAPHAHDAHARHAHDAHARHAAHPVAFAATLVGGVAASGVVLLTLVLPPASLSAELAMSRDTGAAPLFAGSDAVALATTGDTASFGVGEWASVFATATNPDAFDGDPVTLTGFVTPSDSGGAFDLTRLVITHCVIDAQPASISISTADAQAVPPDTGQWVTISGTVQSGADGLTIDASSVQPIDEPEDPYEY